MSTNCAIPTCTDSVHAGGLCMKHYRRFLRHGDPYVERSPRCATCMAVWKVLSRPTDTVAQALDKFTDIWLLFGAGSTYLLKNKDAQGREYDLDIKEEPPCSTEN